MKYIIYIGLAIIEQIFMIIINKEIIHLQYEYISIKYDTFKFEDKEEKFCGLNILIKLFFPIIYIIILSGIFYKFESIQLVENIYIITIFYYVIRWINIIFILNRKELHDWKSEFVIFIIVIALNILLYNTFIIKTDRIFISIDQLRDGIWIGIITFSFVLLRDYIYNHAQTDRVKWRKIKEQYILSKYKYYRNKYGKIIDENNKELESIIYGIMIYENYNRPAFFRFLEYIKLIIKGHATLGVMQVKTEKIISDEESVKIGYKIIKEEYEKHIDINMELDNENIREIVSKYNLGNSYSDEVLYIINVIKCNEKNESK